MDTAFIDKLLAQAAEEMTLEEAKKKKRCKKHKPYSSQSITTGNIDYNIRQFNKLMGTDFPGNDNGNPSTVEAQETAAEVAGDSTASAGEGGEGLGESLLTESTVVLKSAEFDTDRGGAELIGKADKTGKFVLEFNYVTAEGLAYNDWKKTYSTQEELIKNYNKEFEKFTKMFKVKDTYKADFLTEAKRYVKRYYIRPQNIFCSNKSDIIKALIDLEDQNCTVYSLKGLGDNKDVHKLTNKDIIYYYDDGILYDKNRVKLMDYDLYIKHEEERPKFSTPIDQVPDATFEKAYKDRMTDASDDEVTESFNPFNLVFEPKNAYGETLTEAKTEICCICGEEIEGYGNNAEPYKTGRCCDECNIHFVIPARLVAMQNKEED